MFGESLRASPDIRLRMRQDMGPNRRDSASLPIMSFMRRRLPKALFTRKAIHILRLHDPWAEAQRHLTLLELRRQPDLTQLEVVTVVVVDTTVRSNGYLTLLISHLSG
jgi:hypothetical protein